MVLGHEAGPKKFWLFALWNIQAVCFERAQQAGELPVDRMKESART